MAVLYVRVSDECSDWVKAQSEHSGLPIAKVVQALLEHARRTGLTIGRQVVEVREPK